MGADRGTTQSGQKGGKTTPSGVTVWPNVPFNPSSQPQTADRYASAASKAATQQKYGKAFDYETATPGQILDYNTQYGIDTPSTAVPTNYQLTNPYASLFGSGSGSGMKASDILDRDKFNYLKQQDSAAAQLAEQARQDARAKALAQYNAMNDYYTGGDWKSGYTNLINQLIGLQSTGEGQINNAYNSSIGNINAGYGDASKMTGQGYDALNAYLQQNNNNPYVGMAYSPTAITDNSQQFMQAYGVSDPSVQSTLASENQYNQTLGGGFNTMYDLLNRAAQQSQASRMNESQMGRNFAMQNLLSAKNAYGAQAASTKQQALNDLINQISGKKFDVNQSQNEKGTSLEEALLGLVDGTVEKAPVDKTPAEPAAPAAAAYKPALQAIVNKIPALKNETLVSKIEAFAEKNPNATAAQVKKAFPKLAK